MGRVYCCVKGCNNCHAKGFFMTKFPTDPQRRKQWFDALGIKDWSKGVPAVCEIHFSSKDWEQFRWRLNPSAVPSEYLNSYRPIKEVNSSEIKPPIKPPSKRKIPIAPEGKLKLKSFGDHLYCSVPKIRPPFLDVKQRENCATNSIHTDKASGIESSRTSIIEEEVSIPISFKNVAVQTVPAPPSSKDLQLRHLTDELNRAKEQLKELKAELHRVQEEAVLDRARRVYEDLTRSGPQIKQWTDDEVKTAWDLRMSLGFTGYKKVLAAGVSLPSFATLALRSKKLGLASPNERVNSTVSNDSGDADENMNNK